jgi:acyl dehydratase
MRVLNDRDEIKAAEGTELGVSTWLEISQERIDMFADATGDHQWIHVDPHKAASGPFGATVAHGYLTLSLIPFLGAQAFAFAGETARVNYGLDRVRFMAPVRVGSRIRDRVVLSAVNDIERGQQVQLTHTIEIEGSEKPACVAEAIVLLMDS